MAYRELHYNNKPILVAFNVEDITLIANIIRCWKINFNVGQIPPLGIFGYFIPTFQSDLGIGMSFRLIKLDQSSM
jgi:hypothetical protein